LIRDAVPQSALHAGHIFMGFTSCGQFLLSYTQTTTENDLGKELKVVGSIVNQFPNSPVCRPPQRTT
jgi:hypothetical protein